MLESRAARPVVARHASLSAAPGELLRCLMVDAVTGLGTSLPSVQQLELLVSSAG